MDPHGILTLYWTKPIEYLIAISYLVTFVAFWRYLKAPPAGRQAESTTPSRDWFTVPPDVLLHPGHAWARHTSDGLVTVGLDDFARKLVGPVDAVSLPEIGSLVRQGEAAPRLSCGAKSVAMLSPVEGRVVAVNQNAIQGPAIVGDDPYGEGWLFKVRPERWRTDRRQLLSGVLARHFTEGVAETLRREWSPSAVLQDGGQPVDGIARELYGEGWDEFARTYLLS